MTPLPLNVQEQEHLDNDAELLDYVKVWDTIQGEGPFAGSPAVFLRLAGCNLQCPQCDTNYTEGRQKVPYSLLVDLVKATAKTGLVVITGGEPFRQNIGLLVHSLIQNGYHVQIESNGTLFRDNMPWGTQLSVICSPKAEKIHPKLVPHVYAYKYVVEEGQIGDDGFPNSVLGNGVAVARPPEFFPRHRIFLQPADAGEEEQNLKNLYAAVKVCMTKGFRLSLQLHKAIGLE